MAAKKQPIPEVDLASLAADTTPITNDVVNINTVPQPAGDTELAVRVGVFESNEVIDPNDTARIETMLGKSAEAMAASDATAADMQPVDDDYIKVFYHAHTRRYVQFNQALLGRSDFQLRRVRKADFDKLGVSA